MPDKAYTVSPVITINDQGQEVISDLSVSTGHSADVGRDGQVRGVEFDYYEDNKGQIRHRFSEVELESERQSPSDFDESEYIGALLEANPTIADAQQWAEHNLPQEWVDDYNNKIESGDLDDLHKAVEWLLEQYENRSQNSEPEQVQEDDEMEDLSDEEKAVLAEAVENLQQSEAEGEDVAEQWQMAVELAEDSGDETYAMVAAATAAFHAGDISAEEAIDYCLNSCDLKELSRVYKYING